MIHRHLLLFALAALCFFISIASSSTRTEASSSDPSLAFIDTTTLTANEPRASVIDTENDFAYFGMYTDPGKVCRARISSSNFSYDSCIEAPPGADYFSSAVIDTTNSFAYFGTYTSPGQVCRVRVEPSNFTFDGCVPAPLGSNRSVSAVIDIWNSFAYFGILTTPGRVCRVRVEPSNFTFDSCIEAPASRHNFYSAVIDTSSSVAYFGTWWTNAHVCKFDISPSNFAFDSCIELLSGATLLRTAVIDVVNSFAYFSTYSSPSQVCRVRISPSNFSFDSCVEAPSGVNNFLSSVINTASSFAFYGTFTDPESQICALRILPWDFAFRNCVQAPSGAIKLLASVIDTSRSRPVAYFGTYTSPGSIVKVDVGLKVTNSDPSMAVTETVTAPSGANTFWSAGLDLQNSAAFFGTWTIPGQVCKFNISPSNFSFDSCIDASLGATQFRSAVIDIQNYAAFFGTSNLPAQVCKFNISPMNFSFDSCIEAPSGADYFLSAVIDPQHSFVYLGTFTTPGQVCKYNISPTNFSLDSCIAASAGANEILSAVIDPQNSAAYFGAYTAPSQVCKYSISPTNFSLDSCITTPAGVSAFRSAMIDPQNSFAYFGTDTVPGQVCKFNIAPTNFSFDSCITAPGANKFWSAAIDTQNSVAYFGTSTSQICKYSVVPGNFAFDSCITAPSGADKFLSTVIDIQNSAAYFATNTTPAEVVKIDLIAFNCSSDGTLIITQDNISDISREINIVALDQCNVTITDITVGFIGFRGAITNSNITIRNVTCTSLSSPFCIKFSNTVTSTSSSSDFISISDVTFGVGSSFTSSVSLLHFAQSLTIPEATFSNLRLQDFTVTVPSGDLNVFGLYFGGIVTCPSLTIRDIFISDATVPVTSNTVLTGILFYAEVLSGLSSADSDSKLSITNILSSNITYYRKAPGSNHRYLRLIDFRATPNSATNFNSVEISNISVDDVDYGTTSTGIIECVSVYLNGQISAPIGSSSSSLSILDLVTKSIFGETPSGSYYASIHSVVHPTGAPSPAMKHITRVEISHITASNITLRQLGSGNANVISLYFSANSHAQSSRSTSVHIHHVAIDKDITLASSNAVYAIPMLLRDIANYTSLIIEDIYAADEEISLVGTGTKYLIGVYVESGYSINSSGGPSSSFLIRNITVPSPASTSSAHTAYAKTTDNLFDNVNNFYNVTISQLTYLGEWTVPSNLVSSGPVVFSILDSNATSILFNTTISDSNVTVSGVTCELNPIFCLRFEGVLSNLGVLHVSRVEMETSVALRCVWIENNIYGINDTVIVDRVTMSVLHERTSGFGVYAVAFSYTFTTANVNQLIVSNVEVVSSNVTSTTGYCNVLGLALRASTSMKNIVIANISIRDTNVTARDLLLLHAVETQSGVPISAVSSEPTSFIVTNISIVNCRFFKTGLGNANRELLGLFVRGDIAGFERVEISNVLLQDIDGGLSITTGTLGISNVRIVNSLSAPSAPSSSTSLAVFNITAQNLQGQAGTSYAAVHSLRCNLASSIQYFNSIRISRITTSNVTLKALGSVPAVLLQVVSGFTANALISSSTTSLDISDVSLRDPISLESVSGPVSAIPLSFDIVANYTLVSIENIHVADEDISLVGTGTKTLVGVQIEPASSVISAGGPSSSFLIRNITVPSPASTSSAHAAYVKTTDNLFSNVNNFYNVTISQLTYLGEWTVPSNLVSSGPVVFSILDSNATSILFSTAISDSNITVSGVTCELNPTFCVRFDGALTNLGVLHVSRIVLEASSIALLTNGVRVENNINGINDTLIIEHVSFSITLTLPAVTEVFAIAVAFSVSFTTTNVNHLIITNIAVARSNVASTGSISSVSGLALHQSTFMRHIFISNVSIRDTNVTARDLLRLFAVGTQSGVSISAASSSEPTSLTITNVSITNCRFFKTGIGNADRIATGVSVEADVVGFERVEISNVLLQDIDAGMLLENAGSLLFYNVRFDRALSAPSSPSSTTSLTISNITTHNLQGRADALWVVSYALRCPPSIENFNSILISQVSTTNVTLFKVSGQAILAQIHQFAANSLISSSTTSIYISDISLHGPINLESVSGPLSAIPLSFKNIANYTSIMIENIHVAGENIAMTGSGKKDLHSIQLASGSSISSSASSTVVIRNVTVDSPSGVNCSLINFGANTLAAGTWNITSNNFTSPSSHLVSAESTSIFSNRLTMNLRDNYIDVTSDILSQTPSFSLNSSTWNLICNRWLRPVYSRFEAMVEADSSNPTLNLQTCLLTQTRSLSLPPPIFATTLLAVKSYGPISPNLTTYPSYTPPATTAPGGPIRLEEISGKQSVEEIINVLNESRNGATPPMEVILRSADPNLGTFIVRRENLLPSVNVTGEKDDEIRFSGTNLTELAIAIKTGYVFSISPEAEARNLTEGQYVEVVAKDGGNQQGTTAIQLKKIEINRGPQPVFPRIANATFNVSRGKRFVLDLNSTFIHRQQLRMSFAAHRADLFPLPRLMRLVCEPVGNCTIRGVIDTEYPIELEIQASDGYILNASYITLVPTVIPVHPDTSIELLPLMLRPGQDFVYALPTNLFISSTDIEYTAVRLASGFLLPTTMAFDPPNLLRGSYNQEGLLHLQVRASDLFADSARNFTLNFTNVQPFCRNDFTTSSSTTSNSSVPNVRPVAAFQEFERTIEFRDVCADNDNDPLRFDVNAFELPSWLRFLVQPGGTTILPQILRLSGIPPKLAENSLLLINVTVTDLFSSLILSIPLQIAKNEPPVLVRPLPNYTINPGVIETYTVSIDQYFEDPNEDALTISTEILTDYSKSWMSVTADSRNTLTISAKPPDSITGGDDDAKDADEQLRVTVEDPFGNSTTAIINVYVRLTLWQRIRTIVYILLGLSSILLSVISYFLLYPYVYNFFRAGSKQIKCPLNAKNRVWNLPEDGSQVQMRDRAQDEFCMCLRNWARNFSIWAYDELTLEEFPFGDPPTWVEKLDKAMQLGNIEKEPGTEDQVLKKPVYDFCFVRVYNRRGLILVQFEMKYHEITKGWDFELVKEEQKAAAEKKKKQAQQDGSSDISIDFDDDYFGVGNNTSGNNTGSPADDQRLRNMDTKINSIDVMVDEEMKMMKRENRAIKAKNEVLEQKNEILARDSAETKHELSSLRSLVQSLLSSSSPGKPSGSPSAEFSSVSFPLDDDENLEREYDNYAPFDINDGTNDIAAGDKNHDGYEGLTVHQETEEERLARLEFDGDEKGYRAKGEYDRDLEELLEADVRKKNEEKDKKVPTFNPISQQLAKNKFASHTDL